MVEVEPDSYLPNDCWEHVFKFLNDDDKDNRSYLKSVSLVSKRFLSITNHLRSSLTICKELCPFLTAIFHRFPNLTSISFLQFCGDPGAILSEISCFPFNITSLNLRSQDPIPIIGLQTFSQKITSLTSLDCSNMVSISVTDLSLIAYCFPLLEELHLDSISRFVGNMLNGIETISLALSKLRKINLSSHRYMNDQSLFHLFNNCKLLEEVIIFGCFRITNAGIASALRVRPTLRSLSLTNYSDNCTKLLAIVNSCPSISDIEMENYRYHLEMNVDNSYSLMNFVVSPRLKSLCLACNPWLNDESIIMFSSSFPNLQLLDLSYCNQISESICQLLRTSTKIRHLNLEHCSKVKLHGLNFEVPKLEVLNLSHTGVDNESIITFAYNFPNLQKLDLSYCHQICEGICQLLRTSTKIRHLNLEHCSKVKLHGLNFEVPKLEVLNLSHTGVDNESIITFAYNFPNLQKLDLSYCHQICEGICQLLRTSTKIRHLNLEHCSKVKLHGLNFEVPKLEVLNLSQTDVDDESIITFASSFSNLQKLDLSFCDQICEGICQLLRRCSKITHLNLNNKFSKVKMHGLNYEVPKLEVLDMSNTRIKNVELYLISTSFRGLLQLSLEDCYFVTKWGVNHVVKNCTDLRKINLRGCKVHEKIVASMISSRPSLRKIVVPRYYRFENNTRELFIGNICLLR